MEIRPVRRLENSPSLALLTAALGKELEEVSYLFPADSSWPEGYAAGEVDEVEEGVFLAFHRCAPALVTWGMERVDEGVAVVDADNALIAEYSSRHVEQSTQWSRLLKRTLLGLETLWHRAEDSAAETALGLVLRFDGGASVAIALGEVTDDGFSYHPDGLVVMHSDAALTAYVEQIRTAQEGEWETM